MEGHALSWPEKGGPASQPGRDGARPSTVTRVPRPALPGRAEWEKRVGGQGAACRICTCYCRKEERMRSVAGAIIVLAGAVIMASKHIPSDSLFSLGLMAIGLFIVFTDKRSKATDNPDKTSMDKTTHLY